MEMGGAVTKASKLLYTPEGAAEEIDVGRTTMYVLLKRGEIESVKIGRARRVPHEALVAYVDRLRRSQGNAS